jgi:hypothetical protein
MQRRLRRSSSPSGNHEPSISRSRATVPTAGPWKIQARDFAQRVGGKTDPTFSWDKTTGIGGDTLHLTIKRLKADTTLGGAGIFELLSTLGTRQNVWIVAVGDAAH